MTTSCPAGQHESEHRAECLSRHVPTGLETALLGVPCQLLDCITGPSTGLQTALEFMCMIQEALASDIRGQTMKGRRKSQNPGCCTHVPTAGRQAGRHLRCSGPSCGPSVVFSKLCLEMLLQEPGVVVDVYNPSTG